jgi:hypothetical protein
MWFPAVETCSRLKFVTNYILLRDSVGCCINHKNMRGMNSIVRANFDNDGVFQ